MMSADALGYIMNDLFGNVVYAGIDTDKHKYPIGSGRVTFSSSKSYINAIRAAFVEIKTLKFIKKVCFYHKMCNILHVVQFINNKNNMHIIYKYVSSI